MGTTLQNATNALYKQLGADISIYSHIGEWISRPLGENYRFTASALEDGRVQISAKLPIDAPADLKGADSPLAHLTDNLAAVEIEKEGKVGSFCRTATFTLPARDMFEHAIKTHGARSLNEDLNHYLHRLDDMLSFMNVSSDVVMRQFGELQARYPNVNIAALPCVSRSTPGTSLDDNLVEVPFTNRPMNLLEFATHMEKAQPGTRGECIKGLTEAWVGHDGTAASVQATPLSIEDMGTAPSGPAVAAQAARRSTAKPRARLGRH